MDSTSNAMNRQTISTFIEPSLQEGKSHWPTWAIVLVVVCVLLSLLAFLLGDFITKKTASARNKGTSSIDGKDRERKWGAGFSGGLWAAA